MVGPVKGPGSTDSAGRPDEGKGGISAELQRSADHVQGTLKGVSGDPGIAKNKELSPPPIKNVYTIEAPKGAEGVDALRAAFKLGQTPPPGMPHDAIR